MLDQLIIGQTASFDDFGASLSKREISSPVKKEIKETVPFSNFSYDFSAINGELYWEERELKYFFEIIGDDPADLEYKKTAFSNWVMNIMHEDIYDPYETEFHYVGTFSDLDYADDESVEKTTATVTFSAYPYKIANKATNYVFAIKAGTDRLVTVINESGHRVKPVVTTNVALTIDKGGKSFSFPAGTVSDGLFMLGIGVNTLTVKNSSGTDCSLQISFYREVF